MCIFSMPIDRVCKTKLLYALIQDTAHNKRYALTSYSNHVDLEKGNQPTAMILPVPVASPDLIKLQNKAEDKTIETVFKTLHDRFESEKPRMRGMTLGGGHLNLFGTLSAAPLPVIQSGSYQVSIAGGLQDLQRLDKSVFNVN